MITKCLEIRDDGNGRDITFKVRIPYAIVEQQVVDDIKRAKRELILLGGRP